MEFLNNAFYQLIYSNSFQLSDDVKIQLIKIIINIYTEFDIEEVETYKKLYLMIHYQ